MRNFLRTLVLVLAVIATMPAFGAKTVKIRLTGTNYENILLKVGDTGRTEVISALPYVVEVPKDQMPIVFTFESPNYLYYPITVPKKAVDDTGHVYIVKVNETAMSLRGNNRDNMQAGSNFMGSTAGESEIVGIDVKQGVNNAPITGAKNENTFALIITNENYEEATKVDNATNDGLAFKQYCLKTLGVPDKNIKYNADLTYGKMRKALKDIQDLASLYEGKMNLLVYYAGHGIPDNKTKDAYLMPVDADGTDTDVCFSLQKLYDQLNEMKLKKCVVFLDACFSGAQRDGSMIVAARGVKLKPKESKPVGNTIVFSATSGEEAAFSYKEEEHGLFTYYLLKKLQESKGKVSLGELADYLSDNVSKQSRLVNNTPQTPNVSVPTEMTDSWRNIKLR